MPTYLSAGPGLPDFSVEIAFASLPTDATQTWSDVTPYVRQLGIRRGRNNELARVEAGTLDLLLNNRDSRFNPENTAGAYYPNVLPKRAVRVMFRSGGTEAAAFYGYTAGFPQEWPHAGKDAVVQLKAVDLMGLLARARFASTVLRRPLTSDPANTFHVGDTSLPVQSAPSLWPVTFPYTVTLTSPVGSEDLTVTADSAGVLTVTRAANGTTELDHGSVWDPIGSLTTVEVEFSGVSGTVIQNIISNALWADLTPPAGYFANIATGLSTVTSGIIGTEQNPLELVLQIADTEASLFWAGRDGLPVFHDRNYRLTTTTSAGTFGDNTGEMPYTDIGVSHDEEKLYNNIVIAASGGQQFTATDTTSRTAYWTNTLQRQTLGLAGPAQDLAYYLLSKYKDPKLRVPDLSVDGHKVTATTLIGLDLDQRYTVKRRPTTGTIISKDVFVEGVAHTIGPYGHWTTSLNLSDASYEQFWVLGTSTLGQTTRLAF